MLRMLLKYFILQQVNQLQIFFILKFLTFKLLIFQYLFFRHQLQQLIIIIS